MNLKMKRIYEALKQLEATDVTLVYAARDPEINHVVVLRSGIFWRNSENRCLFVFL